MKILLLAPHAFYVDRGTPIDVDILLRALSNLGHTVDVVCYHEGVDRTYPGVTLHRISAPPGVKAVGPGFGWKKLVCDAWMLGKAWGLLRRGRHEVVHAGEEAVFIAKLFKLIKGVPYVYDMDSSIAQQMVEKLGFLRPVAGVLNAFEAWAIRGALAAAPVCHALADLAQARGARHIVTLHDISQLRRPDLPPTGELRRKHDIPGSDVVLMYVGNLEAYQGVDLLLDALVHVRERGANVTTVIAGGTDAHIAAYRDKAVKLGVAERVRFIGRWPADRLDELLAEADILTAPRIKGVNTPQKIFPYMHANKPLLVTDLPTHSQILTQDLARLAPPEPRGFAAAIVELAGDADLRQRLAAAGRAFVERDHVFAPHQQRVAELYGYVDRQRAVKSRG